MAESASKTYSMDPILYMYTSLTAGSSHIITATSRMETILKANRIPFKGVDIATDEKARMLWGRRAGKDESGRIRKIPGLVQMGMVIGDIVEVEDWNEYGELKQHVKIVPLNPDGTVAPVKAAAPKKKTTKASVTAKSAVTKSGLDKSEVSAAEAIQSGLPMRSLAEQAAQRAKDLKKQPLGGKISTKSSTTAVKSETTFRSHSINEPVTLMQSPITSSWNITAETYSPAKAPRSEDIFSTPTPKPSATSSTSTRRSLMFEPSRKEVQIEDVVASFGSLASMQSPNSTAWKPLDMGSIGGLNIPFDTEKAGPTKTVAAVDTAADLSSKEPSSMAVKEEVLITERVIETASPDTPKDEDKTSDDAMEPQAPVKAKEKSEEE